MPFWDKLESDWTFTGEDYKSGIGSDKSHRYMKNKKSVLYIATDSDTQRVIGLKPFIDSFKIDIKMKVNETESIFSGRKFKAAINMGATYSIGLTVPAASVNEARMNKRKIELLPKFLEEFDSNKRILKPKRHYLYLNNLIHNGMRVAGDGFVMAETEGQTYANLIKFACGGYITEANYTIVTEDGFFEYESKLFPKTYKLSISFIAFNEQRDIENNTTHYLTDGYANISGGTNLKIGKGWPFGVEVKNIKKSSISSNNFGYNFLVHDYNRYDQIYSKNKNAHIYIFPKSLISTSKWYVGNKTKRALAFKPYLESFSFSRKTTKNELFSSFQRSEFYAYPAEDASFDLTFNVLAEDPEESIAIHAKFQELIKMISPASNISLGGAVRTGSEESVEIIQNDQFIIEEKKQNNSIKILFSNVIYNTVHFKDSLDPANPAPNQISDVLKNKYNVDGSSYVEYYQAARPFNLTDVSYDPFIDMGFFEFNGMLWPKGYKLSLKLTENYSEKRRRLNYRLISGREKPEE